MRNLDIPPKCSILRKKAAVPKRVLIVDDEPQRLAGLSQELAQLCPDWEVSLLNSGNEGLEFLATHPCDVVISDMGMPAMDGAQFLNEVSRRHPAIIRFLMSETQDKQAMMQSAFGSFQCLPHPCAPEILRSAVTRAMALDRWGGTDQMKRLITRIRTFPSIPSLYFEVLKELRSTDASVDRVGGIIAKDLAMCTKMLQVLNSAFYGLPRQITDPIEAVNLLGFEVVKSLVLCIQVFSQFDQIKPNYFSIDKLWRHSTAVAQAARRIARFEEMDEADADETYTAGLLHDIGKLVLANNFGEQCLEAHKLAREQNTPLWNVEKQIFGVSHAEIGAYLIAHWGLPLVLAETAALHHCPLADEDPRLGTLTAVHAANVLVYDAQADHDGAVVPSIDEAYLARLNLADRVQTWAVLIRGRPVERPKTIVPSATAPVIPPERLVPASRNYMARRWGIPAVLAGCAVMCGWLFFRTPPAPSDPGASSEVGPSPPESAPAPPSQDAVLPAQDSAVPVPQEPSETKREPAEPQSDGAAAQTTNSVAPQSSGTLEAKDAPPPEPPVNSGFENLKLQGIFFSNTNPSATINNRTLTPGEEIQGVKLVSITPKTVTLEYRGETKTLSLE